MIKVFVADEVATSEDEYCAVKRDKTPGSKRTKYTYLVDGVVWSSSYADPQAKRYWNFASTVRSLREAYLDQEQTDGDDLCCPDNDDEYDYGEPCFHRSSLAMLFWLQKRAWNEIRVKVMLTIGTILPAELTELVFEHAIQAEKLPMDLVIKETTMAAHPKSRPIMKTKVSSIYQCAGLRERLPEGVSWHYESSSESYDDSVDDYDSVEDS